MSDINEMDLLLSHLHMEYRVSVLLYTHTPHKQTSGVLKLRGKPLNLIWSFLTFICPFSFGSCKSEIFTVAIEMPNIAER